MTYSRILKPKDIKYVFSEIQPHIKQHFFRFLKQNKCYASYTAHLNRICPLASTKSSQLINAAFTWGSTPQGGGLLVQHT